MTDADATASGSSWSDSEIETMITTAAAFAIASLIVWWFLLRPILAFKEEGDRAAAIAAGGRPPAAAAAAAGATTPNARRRAGGGTPRAAPPASPGPLAGIGGDDGDEHAISSILRRSRRRPPHLAANAGGGLAASSLLHEGALPFRATAAATYETRLAAKVEINKQKAEETKGSTEEGGGAGAQNKEKEKDEDNAVLTNRRERARLFTRLFNPSVTGAAKGSVPPSRGSNVVVSVPAGDASKGCPKLRRALTLLGTYYNLFVVLVLEPAEDDAGTEKGKDGNAAVQALRDRLRGKDASGAGAVELPEEVLPDHRIVAVRSVTGRVAFVRQLSRPEFVLDCDPEIEDQLGRFGFTVLLYSATPVGGGATDSKTGSSALGRALLP